MLRAAAGTYLDLVAAVTPAERVALVPAPGFPRSELDGRLRALLLDVAPCGAVAARGGGGRGRAARATVLDLPDADDLPALLSDVVPGLLAAPPASALPADLGVHRLGPAELADRLLGVRRPADWWRAVYAALEPAAETVPGLLDELRALPVPLADGRTVPGPASVLLPLGTVPTDMPALPGLHIAHPDAVHPLLLRLGATLAEPAGLLDHPAVRDAVERSVDDAEAGLDPVPLAEAVLALVDELGPAGAAARSWLSALALTDVDGEPARADELVLPDAALRPLLADDAPLAVLGPEWERRASREVLAAVGVVDGFTVLHDDDVGAPEHGLDDVERWIDELAEPPAVLVAVRDLDLIRDDAWPAALGLLAARPETRAAVLAAGSYTAWWLARHALLHGHRPGHWRLPSASGTAALYDAVPETSGPLPDDAVLAAAGVRADARRRRRPRRRGPARPPRRPGAAPGRRADRRGARGAGGRRRAGPGRPGGARPAGPGPRARRARSPTSTTPSSSTRRGSPPSCPAGEVVVGGDPRALADLLDLPTASEVVDGEVAGTGRPVPWGALAEVVVTCDTLGVAVPAGELWCHEELWVVLHRPTPGRHRVPTWRAGDGGWHADDPVRALLAVLGDG